MSQIDEANSKSVKTLLTDAFAFLEAERNAKNRLSDRFAPNFNMFDHLRRDEMGVSNIIAFLLNPRGNHGQGAMFLHLFCAQIGIDLSEDPMNSEVDTEVQANGQRRIDVLVDMETLALAIENKPWAGDQQRQLEDYSEFLRRRSTGKRWCLIYLCDQDPSDFSISLEKREALEAEGNYRRVDFPLLEKWLRECARDCRAPIVRMFIEHFADFVHVHIRNQLGISEVRHMTENILLRDERTIGAAIQIATAVDHMKFTLLNSLRTNLDMLLHQEGLFLDWRMPDSASWKANVGFGAKLNDVADDFCLQLAFDGTALTRPYWGISWAGTPPERPPKDTRWNAINEIMADALGTCDRPSDWWPWWSYRGFDDYTGLDRNWSTDPTPWIGIKTGDLARKFVEKAVSVRESFRNKGALDLLSRSRSSV